MEKNFTKQESLNLINEMIAQAKNNIQKGSANTMIFAGYTVAVIAILNFILLEMGTLAYKAFWIWLLTIPMSVGCFIISRRIDRKSLVRTHVDKIVSTIWITFFYSVVLFLACVFGFALLYNGWMLTVLITPVILIMMGAAQYITAVTSRFRPFRIGAIVFWIGALICIVFPLVTDLNLQFIVLAICMILGFVVPGHILNSKAVKNV
ncbi:MFS family permease [Dysgonomonas sp. PFB1-18]|uniref:hypothetical protein n=1 Tax=unclassified Dysgonomonas TaxID=2630389 RepID=UPI0024730ADF|nr:MULTISPECIES: hypothetical protein [unclassified Dysgonomonas]MDH6310777.1 MFS family permease [Dysgonomonas sp. PF1-14]MDH6340627.1 MFS family permease [Dysgonomonas sp. PF1-16]MDH6382266.1 MFS family permease [Dysgonomonas sp. PFB1-18]MDH6399597.1 MFS family permease [Dysgonomonas sp. PF1-23]